MSDIPEPTFTPTVFEVSCIPQVGHPDRSLFTLTVEYRGAGRWAVRQSGWCYDIDGERDYESIPSERREEWLERHRFDLDTATALAKRIAPTLTYGPRANPYTVADMLAKLEAERLEANR